MCVYCRSSEGLVLACSRLVEGVIINVEYYCALRHPIVNQLFICVCIYRCIRRYMMYTGTYIRGGYFFVRT